MTKIDDAIKQAQKASKIWSDTPLDARIKILLNYQKLLTGLELIISEEVGKPLWESKTEVEIMRKKIDLAIEAYNERCATVTRAGAITRHVPHGVVAVLGPFNFPGHLPNGHIVPALLAGNTIVFKPSEYAPKTGKFMAEALEKAGLPKGVLNLVEGGRDVGKELAEHPGINGLFFTGSSAAGESLLKFFSNHPEKILALEMGGNNPLIVWDVKDAAAAAYLTIQSAYLTSGQRCTCARRLIVGKDSQPFIDKLIEMTQKIKVGFYNEIPEPFMGPVISEAAGKRLMEAQEKIKGKILVPMKNLGKGLITPGLMDVTEVKDRVDEEYFGPFLQLIRVNDFDAAIKEANNTSYGLSASLLSDREDLYKQFFNEIKAGIVNWNMPTTGASGSAPFGGIGKSGNFRPSAYYAVDYCSYPVASMEKPKAALPEQLPPGLSL